VRFIHTSDWHLGHRLHNQTRHEEHHAFLEWLLDQLVEKDVDALIIAGDIFDTPNPSAEATRTFYQFLHNLHQRAPHLEVVIIGGNHDSAHRLEAPQTLLKDLNVNVIGGLPPQRDLDFSRLYIPLHDASGEVGAWVLAVPYLRPSDLPNRTPRPENYLIEGVREVYQKALEGLEPLRSPDQALIITGHCYMAHGKLSEESERKILGDHQHALPLDLFPKSTSYVALGHLHLAQMLGDCENVRYSGSPIPLSLAERHYQHQVVLVELEGATFRSATPLYIPREVEMIRIPDLQGGLSLQEILEEIEALPALDPDLPNWRRPFLHICIDLKRPEPHFKNEILAALKGKAVRLVRIQTIRAQQKLSLSSRLSMHQLSDLKYEDVFRLRWEREWPETPISDESLQDFQTLFVEVIEEEES
jgi:DNA repair protein SbcD/Mre11